MFEESCELAEIVIALEVEPRIVRGLYEEWRVGPESWHLRRTRAARANQRTRREAALRRDVRDWERLIRAEPEQCPRPPTPIRDRHRPRRPGR